MPCHKTHQDVPKPNGTTAGQKPEQSGGSGRLQIYSTPGRIDCHNPNGSGASWGNLRRIWAKPHPETPRQTLQNQLESSGMDKTAACPVSIMTATQPPAAAGGLTGQRNSLPPRSAITRPGRFQPQGEKALDFHRELPRIAAGNPRTIVRHAKLRQRRTHRPRGASRPQIVGTRFASGSHWTRALKLFLAALRRLPPPPTVGQQADGAYG